jgi:hypothetical protein
MTRDFSDELSPRAATMLSIMRSNEPRQMRLDEGRWGGFRPGAGRKKGKGSRVPHRKREGFSCRHPVHVTLRIVVGLPSLRTKRCFQVIREALRQARERFGMRVIHYSTQGNHLHLLVDPGFAGTSPAAPGHPGCAGTWSTCWVMVDVLGQGRLAGSRRTTRARWAGP